MPMFDVAADLYAAANLYDLLKIGNFQQQYFRKNMCEVQSCNQKFLICFAKSAWGAPSLHCGEL